MPKRTFHLLSSSTILCTWIGDLYQGRNERVRDPSCYHQVLNMGIIRLGNLKEIRQQMICMINMPFVWSVFSCDHFFQNCEALHEGARYWQQQKVCQGIKIRLFVVKICPSFEAAFTPGQQLYSCEWICHHFQRHLDLESPSANLLKVSLILREIKVFVLVDSKWTEYMNSMSLNLLW